jgi:hypothetical protein
MPHTSCDDRRIAPLSTPELLQLLRRHHGGSDWRQTVIAHRNQITGLQAADLIDDDMTDDITAALDDPS